MRGGYQIITLKGVNHENGVGMVHNGLYDRIEGSEKPILLEGIVIDGVEKKPTYVAFDVNESNYTATVYGYTLTIQSTDVATFAKEGGEN